MGAGPANTAVGTISRQVHFRPQASAELIETRRWYDEKELGLGAQFTAAVEDAIERIRSNPFTFACVHGEARRAILRRFPYAIDFRVLDDSILVLAVMHGKRHPRRWQSRA